MTTETKYQPAEQIGKIIEDAQHIVVIQADNIDADSLASSLALEQILGEMGKQVSLYCGIDITNYLHFLPGWDRVQNRLPNDFDAAILVDCSSLTLLEKLEKTGQMGALRTRPFIILDHHEGENDVTINCTELIDTKAVATGEVIYLLAKQLGWKIDDTSANFIASSIMADSLGLTIDDVTSRSIHVLAEVVDHGANLAALESRRREFMTKTREIIAYKGKLLQRIEYYCDNQLAVVTIPWDEIQTYSPLYNPAILALEELRVANGVKLAIVFKLYPDGKITGKLRCNYGVEIASKIAEKYDGGGHPGSAGFKTTKWKYEDLKSDIIHRTTELLGKE